MDLSPNDIRNYQFATQMRGYARDAVDAFREQMAVVLETARQEHLRLSMEVESLKTQLAALRQFEDTIKSAAIDARRNADMTVANAKKEADLILGHAKAEAEKVLGSRGRKATEIDEQITRLQLAKRSYLSKLRRLIKSHLQVLDEIASGAIGAATQESLEVTDSTEISRGNRETFASTPDTSQPIKTEQAKAGEQIVSLSMTGDAMAPAASASDGAPASDSFTPPTARSVDPELVAALRHYRHQDEPSAASTPAPHSVPETMPPPASLVETKADVGEIPMTYVSADDTGRISVRGGTDSRGAAATAVAVQAKPVATAGDARISPDRLAEELDRVVAKFEEEMDKAAKA
ncbi:MAG TPA: DivIVA domain-containing protein [Candidatus Deferrimicrobium sp.]|nr:DivIVA domain-containing protein [Candidatus Deferrimicrobium sp.]